MANRLLHTPEGVRDIYGEECEKKRVIQQKISHVFHLYGYQTIETPTFEFFDIFNEDRGSVGSREMFKFFDRDNNTLVLRPDMTPSIARCAAKFFMNEEMPIRLSYLERTFINSSSYQGRLKEVTQTGAELIGDDSSGSDAEVIAMVIHSLKAAGLVEFQVELGQVDFFRGLVEEADMDEDTQEQLRLLIENKNHFGVEELVTAQSMPENLSQVFLRLPELFGSLDQIHWAKSLTTNQRALQAIDRLEKIHRILEDYELSEYVSYDLGMLNQYKYYTGIIFKAYAHGTGDYLVTGGRYDKLLLQFGKDAPAVGFAIVVDQVMLALARQKIETKVSMVNTMILYTSDTQSQAIQLAGFFRKQDLPVQLIRKSSRRNLEEYRNYAVQNHLHNLLQVDADRTMVHVMNVNTGITDIIPLSAYQ